MAKTAVFQNGNRQYLVQEGDIVLLEKLNVEDGKAVQFDKVLMAATDKTVKMGKPLIDGAVVEGKVLGQGKHEKVFGAKVKAKKRNKQFFGHKQRYTKIEITKIATK